MEKLPMCRICLVQNVRMYFVVNKNLHEFYEKMTNIQFVTEDRRPTLACFICYAKLKKWCQFLRKCLKAEERFTQMMNKGYEANHSTKHDDSEFYSGFIKSPTQHTSIVDECQFKTITFKEELPDVCEGFVDITELKEEHQSDELELENLDNSCLDVVDVLPHDSESDLEDDVPLMGLKIKEQKVTKKKRASETKSATAAKKTKLVEALTAEQTKEEISESKHIRTIQKHVTPIPSTSAQWGAEALSGSRKTSLPLERGYVRGGRKSIRRGQRPQRTAKLNLAINYGSEDDSEDDVLGGEHVEGLGMVFIPRAQRMYLEEEDSVVDEVVASVEQTPQSEAESSQPLPSPPSTAPTPSSSGLEPTNMYNFEWRSFPVPPVAPTERREVFSEINCGPTTPLLTPYDAFVAIWSRDIMEHIANETNEYAQALVEKRFQDGSLGPASRITHWRDTNVDELYVFFGLILATGICVRSDLTEYWTKDDILVTPIFPQFMSHNRFLLLSSCLHFNKNSSDLKRLSRSQARLYKIAPVLDHLNSQFQSLYRLGRNIAIDESLTQWTGILEFKQFTKNKVASSGIKMYEVCEVQTGYLWRFRVHTGRMEETEQEVTPVSGVTATLVLDLLKGLEYKGRTVWMDNYYNSPALARVLKTLGFDSVGTFRTSQQYVPKQLATLTKSQMAVGETVGCTSGDVDILVWRDQNRVAMISTYHGAAVQSLHGKTKPTAVHDYNACMAGVDRKDQMLSVYPIERKRTQGWYKKLFRRLLNVSVFNAFILHKSSVRSDKRTAVTDHREFRKTLIRELLRKHKERLGVDLTGLTKAWTGPRAHVPNVPVFPREVLQHFPQQYGFIPGRNKERVRHSCVVCHKRVSTLCSACNVALCLDCAITFHK